MFEPPKETPVETPIEPQETPIASEGEGEEFQKAPEQPAEPPKMPSDAEIELIKQQNEFMKTELVAIKDLMSAMGVNKINADAEKAEKERLEKIKQYARSF